MTRHVSYSNNIHMMSKFLTDTDTTLATNSHNLCNPDIPTGCERCGPREQHICCDICHPEEFSQYRVAAEKAQKSASKSHIKPFTMSGADYTFKKDLQDWRRRAAVTKFGTPRVRTLGVRILMPEPTLNRIVDCAHAGKILNKEQLLKESGWGKERVEEFAEDVIAMIHRHYPPAPVPASGADQETTGRKRAPGRCSACHETGHISASFTQFFSLLNVIQ